MESDRRMQARDGERAPSATSRPTRQSTAGPRRLVLVIEDSEDDFYLLQRAFKKQEGHGKIVRLVDGAKTIDYLRKAKEKPEDFPALLLLDLKLPGTSGFDVLKWVRNDPVFKLLPVNVLTSSAEPTDVQKAFELGANAFTVKPMSLNEYEDLVATLLKFWFDLGELPRPS